MFIDNNILIGCGEPCKGDAIARAFACVKLTKTRTAMTVLLALLATGVAAAERELIQDNQFQRGFILWEPKPGQHLRYGELKGAGTDGSPVWGMAQWSSRFPLNPAALRTNSDGSLACSNHAKNVRFAGPSAAGSGLVLGVNAGEEYGAHARQAGDPWVHLLVEQEFEPTTPLSLLAAAKFRVEARFTRARNLHHGDYSPGVHAAQFQIFFTVQNRNRTSPGHGDLLWFGVPIYDNRDRFPQAFKAQDFGGTAKFIFTPGGTNYTARSAHDGGWIVLERDLLPLMREALETAWSRGFLKGSKAVEDYHIGGMNLGWELPGTFDVEMEIRNLSLRLVPKTSGSP